MARFVMKEEESSGLEEELREAFRLYDKEVSFMRTLVKDGPHKFECAYCKESNLFIGYKHT